MHGILEHGRQVRNEWTVKIGTGGRTISEWVEDLLRNQHLTGSTVIGFSTNSKWMTDSLGKIFSGDYEKFSETMCRLGGVFNGKLNSGGYSWLLEVLPKIPIQIVYYDGDDEFPCEVQILFDKNASRFMEFECLAFLEGCLVRALSMTAKTGDTAGWA
ncbi:MAG TPA: DUF3786 domain-containing protein [Candidatus Brocadiaceae bacterium]